MDILKTNASRLTLKIKLDLLVSLFGEDVIKIESNNKRIVVSYIEICYNSLEVKEMIFSFEEIEVLNIELVIGLIEAKL